MRKFLYLALIALLAMPASVFAAGNEDAMISELQKQIADLVEELDDLNDRVDDAERHATLDRIEFTGDMRQRVNSLHYEDVTFNPGITVDYTDFFMKTATGEFGDVDFAALQAGLGMYYMDLQNVLAGAMTQEDLLTMYGPAFAGVLGADTEAFGDFLNQLVNMPPSQQNTILAGMFSGQPAVYPMVEGPSKYDLNNDILFTSRLRLNMKAKVWNNVKFSGRLTMFKNWGDSTGSKVFDSWNAFTMDGTNTGSTSGDLFHVDRAYFDWSNIGDTGIYASIGRRPSTYGPPTEFRENELRGGTPTGNVMNLNFDGITIGRSFAEETGIEGFMARFCYGQGYESEWGNGEMFNNIKTKDTHFAGFNFDLLNDGTNFLQTTIFRAQDINDGFKGVIAFPTEYGALFAPTLYKDMQKFPTFNFVTRVQPSTTIGDINLGGLVFSRKEDNGVNWFISGGWTQLKPNGNAGMFGGMGTDAVFQAELSDDGTEIYMVPKTATESKTRNGYGAYVGVQVPAPMGKIGLEYNYGSKYYTPFTQNMDDAVGSKLATRGHVGELYYIVDINPRMFLRLSGMYYDFEYSGSGSPVGAPQKIDDIKNGTAYSLMPVVDNALDLNASLTLKF
jgi:hypothetical protein